MLSVGDGIAIGGFVIVVAQFVLAYSKNKTEKNDNIKEFTVAHSSEDVCAAQFNLLDKKVALFENDFKHFTQHLAGIEKKMEQESEDRRHNEALLFKKIDQLFVKIDSIKKGQ